MTPRPPRQGPQATVTRGRLASAVAHASRPLARSRGAASSGAVIRAEVAGGLLTLSSSAKDLAARAAVSDGADLVPGVVQVDGAELASAVRALRGASSSPALLRADGGVLTIACGGAEAAIPALRCPGGRRPFPRMPAASGTVAGDDFARSVARVAAAAGRDKRRPELTRLLLELGEEYVTLAAMDRSRIATDSVAWAHSAPPPGGRRVLVPAADLAWFAAGSRGTVTIHAPGARAGGTGYAGFSDGSREMIVAACDQPGPLAEALRSRVADGPATVVTCDARLVRDAVRLAGRRSGHAGPVHLALTEHGMLLSPGQDGAAPAAVAVPARWAGTATSAWFDSRLLAGALGGVAGEARLTLTQAPGPAQIATAGDGDRYRVLVMPVVHAPA